MIQKQIYNNLTWIDLESPTHDEVRMLIDEHQIDPLVANELLSPTLRSRVDLYPNGIYLILHFPIAQIGKEADPHTKTVQEVDFFIGHDFIITTHYDSIDALHDFSKVFEVNSILDKSDMGHHCGYIFFYMIETFYRDMMERIENIRHTLGHAESRIFSGEEKKMVIELSQLKRLLLTFKESLTLHREVLQSFDVAGQKFFGEEFKYHLHGILGEYYKVQSAMDSTKEYLDELRDTNDSLLSTKQNEVMKTLTVVNFIILPLSLLAGIFGMNTITMPIIGHPRDFLIVVLAMLCVALIIFIYVKSKKWL